MSRCTTRIVLTLYNSGDTGAQADDSIIFQFLLDWRDNNDVLGANFKEQADHKEFKLPKNKQITTTEGSICGLLTVRQQIADAMKKNGAEQLWVGHFLFFSRMKTNRIISSRVHVS